MYVHSSIHLFQRDFQTTLTSLKTLFAWTSRMLKAKWWRPEMLGKCKRRHFSCLNQSNRLKWTKHAKVPNTYRKNELIMKFFWWRKKQVRQKKSATKKVLFKRKEHKKFDIWLVCKECVAKKVKHWESINNGAQ